MDGDIKLKEQKKIICNDCGLKIAGADEDVSGCLCTLHPDARKELAQLLVDSRQAINQFANTLMREIRKNERSIWKNNPHEYDYQYVRSILRTREECDNYGNRHSNRNVV